MMVFQRPREKMTPQTRPHPAVTLNLGFFLLQKVFSLYDTKLQI